MSSPNASSELRLKVLANQLQGADIPAGKYVSSTRPAPGGGAGSLQIVDSRTGERVLDEQPTS